MISRSCSRRQSSLRAARKAGELLKETAERGERDRGHGDRKSRSQDATPKAVLGVPKTQSSSRQKLALDVSSAASDFIRDTRPLIEQLRFDVQDIVASDNRAVIIGELATRITATGKIIESVGIILTVSDGSVAARLDEAHLQPGRRLSKAGKHSVVV
jgi:hypothetical protein